MIMCSVTSSYFSSRSSERKRKTAGGHFKLSPAGWPELHPPLAVLTVIEEHVDRVERSPADGEQHDDGDHHFDGSLLLPVGEGGGQQKGQGHGRTGTTSTLSLELFDLNLLNYLHLGAISQGVGTATVLC